MKSRIQEAVGGDAELAALLEQKMLANDGIATSFLGGFMRNRDYTQKSQTLADERRTLEGQVESYRTQLEAAEGEKAKVLKDLATHKVTVAQAHARLKHLKDTYALSDDDVPAFADLIDTSKRGQPVDSSTDIDQKLVAFEKKITTYLEQKLVPELGGMTKLNIVWDDIRDEHRELTGKRMTVKQQDELLDEATRRANAGRPISLKGLWEEKYDAPTLRQKQHDTEFEKNLRAKWDAEEQAKRSEAALAGIRPVGPDQQGLRTSQIFDHKFKVHEEAPAEAAAAAAKPRVTSSASERQALSGAERAGKHWLERRAAGIPMGAPDEKKAGGKAA